MFFLSQAPDDCRVHSGRCDVSGVGVGAQAERRVGGGRQDHPCGHHCTQYRQLHTGPADCGAHTYLDV